MSSGYPNPPGALDTPEFKEWMGAVVQQLLHQMDGKVKGVQDELLKAIQGLKAPVSSSTPNPKPANTSPPPISTSSRQQLPHPEPFDGKDKALFRPWKTSVIAKVRIEGHLIGDQTAQFYYVHSRLRDKALQMASPYVDQCVSLSSYDSSDLIRYLSTIYDDPNRAERALRDLNTLKQSQNATFARFLPVFEKALSEAGCLQWPDNIKINHLYNTLSSDLKKVLVTISLPSKYPDYIRKIQEIAARFESLEKPHSNSSSRKSQEPAATKDSIDWEPLTTQNAALKKANEALKGKQAKWVSQDKLQKRRKEKRCFRYG